MDWLLGGFIFCIGLLFGSFSTMASYRIPRDEDLVFKRSNCPKCKHPLGVLDLIPVVSWAIRKGKCRYCKAPVSMRYPLIELFCASLFLAIFWRFGLEVEAWPIYVLGLSLVIMIAVDLEHKIIPDMLQIIMLLAGVGYHFILATPWSYVILNAVFYLSFALLLRWGFYLWKRKEGLGFGDVKFFAVTGVWIDVNHFVAYLFISGISGILLSIIWRKIGRGQEFPFGPALGLALLACLFWPEYTFMRMIK